MDFCVYKVCNIFRILVWSNNFSDLKTCRLSAKIITRFSLISSNCNELTHTMVVYRCLLYGFELGISLYWLSTKSREHSTYIIIIYIPQMLGKMKGFKNINMKDNAAD